MHQRRGFVDLRNDRVLNNHSLLPKVTIGQRVDNQHVSRRQQRRMHLMQYEDRILWPFRWNLLDRGYLYQWIGLKNLCQKQIAGCDNENFLYLASGENRPGTIIDQQGIPLRVATVFAILHGVARCVRILFCTASVFTRLNLGQLSSQHASFHRRFFDGSTPFFIRFELQRYHINNRLFQFKLQSTTDRVIGSIKDSNQNLIPNWIDKTASHLELMNSYV